MNFHNIRFYKESKFKKALELGIKIPEDWEVVRLGDVATIETGKRAKGGGLTNGTVISIGGEHISKDGRILWNNNTKYIPEDFYKNMKQGKVRIGDILMVKDGATTGKVAIVKDIPYSKVAVNEHVFIIRNKKDTKVINEFLFYILFSHIGQNQIKIKFHGMIGGIKNDDVKSLLIPLPPLEEQRKIAEILSTVDKAIEKVNESIAKTERLKKGLMQELLSGEIRVKVENGRISFYKETQFENTEIGKVPEDWEVVRLGDVASFCRGYSYRSSDLSTQPTKLRFITINDLEKEGGLKSNAEQLYLREDIQIDDKFYLKEDDLLIANTDMSKGFIIGAPLLISKTLIKSADKLIYSMDLTKLVLKTKKVSTKFLFYFLSLERIRRIMKTYAQGTNVLHLNHNLAKTLNVIIPPLEEQKKIAQILSNVDKRIELLKKKKELLEKVKKYFMQKLLTGEVRVCLSSQNDMK